MKTTSILIVGVGGQGILLASELIADAAFLQNFDVKKSDVHGMAQRGGVVSSHIRFGQTVYSPLIPTGQADILLAFEEMEALRWIHMVRSDGLIVVNQQKLMPPIAVMNNLPYPENPVFQLKNRVERVIALPAIQVAQELGNARVMNLILLGMLSTGLQLEDQVWQQAIRNRVPKGTEDLNIQAFHTGQQKAGAA